MKNEKQKNGNRVDMTFISDNEVVQNKLRLFGYSFTYAVAVGEAILAKKIINEARQIKKDAERQLF